MKLQNQIELVSKAKFGDTNAQDLLIAAYMPTIKASARDLLGPDHPELNDAVQYVTDGMGKVIARIPERDFGDIPRLLQNGIRQFLHGFKRTADRRSKSAV